MAASYGHTEATETSPLLGTDDAKRSKDASLTKSTNGTVDTVAFGSQNDGAEDEENGEAEEVVNPIFEGIPEVAARLHWLLPAVGIGIFLSAAEQTITVSSYGRIGSELNALNSTSWIASAYFLTLTTFQPLYGKVSDIFGRKPALLFAYSIFGLGCLFCGLARDMPELIAARAFAGIGGGGMSTVVSIMMSDIIPLRNRGTWQGYVNIIYACGSSAGAPLGGILADTVGWRWAFIGQAPLCLLAFIAVYFILDLPKVEHSHWKEKLGRVDFLGAFCLVVATSSLLLGMDHGSNYAWNNKTTIAFLGASIPLYVLFVLVEMKVASHPFAPGHIIFERSLSAAYLCNFFAFAGFMSSIFYIPLYFQAVNGLSATQAGLRLLPSILCSVTGSVSGGLIMQKTGKYYWLTIFAYSVLFLGTVPILLCSGVVLSSTKGIIVGLCMQGLGGGIGVTTSLIALIANADPKDQAIVTACSYLFRSLGSVVGVSLSATVVQQVLRNQLRAHLDDGDAADKIVERVRQSLDYIKELDPHTRHVVRLCYQKATGAAFSFSMIVVSGAVLSSFFIREKKLSK